MLVVVTRVCFLMGLNARPNGIPWVSFTKADRRVTCFYFYVWDTDFGPAFIKACAYFPYPIKVWLNGHEWAVRHEVARDERTARKEVRMNG